MTPVRRYIASSYTSGVVKGAIHRVYDKESGYVGPEFAHYWEAQLEANALEAQWVNQQQETAPVDDGADDES